MPTISDSKCFLVIGATSGIGRSLARSIQALPSKPKVIVAGRRQERLDELTKENFDSIQVDVDTDAESLKKFVNEVLNEYPDVSEFVFRYDFFAYVLIYISSSTGLCSRLEFSEKSTLRNQRKSTLTVWIPNGSLVNDNRY
jgi:NAD(P)-dependent dehydrogenase (short-subunit alcohol dehydrogenase family)